MILSCDQQTYPTHMTFIILQSTDMHRPVLHAHKPCVVVDRLGFEGAAFRLFVPGRQVLCSLSKLMSVLAC